MIDTHAHLCDEMFSADRREVLECAFASGVEKIVEIAERPEAWPNARVFASSGEFSGRLFWTAGLHPHHAGAATEESYPCMIEAARHERCVAIGEIGLDFHRNGSHLEIQKAVFLKCLEAARQAQKPVVIHCRDAWDETLSLLHNFYGGEKPREIRGVFHCFQGEWEIAKEILEMGFMLGVDGPITYPTAKGLREVFTRVSLERLVLETDSPYLPPQGYRGKRNEPSYLRLIAERLAEIRGVPFEEVVRQTSLNARRLFRIE